MSLVPLKIRISEIEGQDPRIADCEIEKLQSSLSRNSLLVPIRVRAHPSIAGKYQLVFGNRRLSAAKKLGWEYIEAEVVRATDEESLIQFLAENLDRRDLCDYEKALALQTFHKISGKSYSDIAAVIGRSPAFVSHHLAMLVLFPETIATEEERVRAIAQLSEKHARVLAGIRDPVERWNTAKLAICSNLSVRELEKVCSRYEKERSSTKSRLSSRSIAEVISNVVSGLNSKDVRPLFESASERNFSLFSRFPPFDQLDIEAAKDHVCEILSRIERFHYRVVDMEVRSAGDFAYVIMKVVHELRINGKDLTTKTRATVILEKEDGWRIVHEHWSSANPNELPFDLVGPVKSQASEREHARVLL